MSESLRFEPHCILGRIVTRRGRTGLPESRRETECCQERHAEWFMKHGGWEILISDTDMPIAPVVEPAEPAQSGPNRTGEEESD